MKTKIPRFVEKTDGECNTIIVQNPDWMFDENNPNQKKIKRNSNFTPKRKKRK